jgi:hypothetical protein
MGVCSPDPLDILFEYNPIWTLLCLFLGLAYSAILYYRQKRLPDLSKGMHLFLAGLRTLSVAVIAFLLLGPFFRYFERQTQKPIIVIAQDNSSSILISKDSSFYKNGFQEELKALTKALSEEYTVETYLLDKDLEATSEAPDFKGKQTDLSFGFKTLYERNINRNIGAIILASDGIYNRGSSPVYLAEGRGIPVFTIAEGDTTQKKDLVLEDVAHNRLAYLGNDFPLEISLRAFALKGERTKVSVRTGGETVFSRTIDISESDYLTSYPLVLKASQVGRQYIDVSLDPLPGEFTQSNNTMRIFVDVLDSRQKVLLLYGAPHPDIAALRQAISTNENYEVETRAVQSFNLDIADYDLVIAHGIPGKNGSMNDILTKSRAAKIPVLLIYSLQSDAQAMSKEDLGIGFTIRSANSLTDAIPSLAKGFTLFQWSDDVKQWMKDLPPLQTPFGQAQLQSGAQAALHQKIGVVETDQPMWAFRNVNGFKSSVILGEGLWRWRMADFLSNQNHARFDELISKAMQYLAAKEDKRFFIVYAETSFDEDEDIVLDAELYDAGYNLYNDPDVLLELDDNRGNRYDFVFNRSGNAYRLNAGRLPAGTYSYKAATEYGDNSFQTTGSFDVKEVRVEERRTKADHQLLYRLSESTGGKMFLASDLSGLENEIRSAKDMVPIIYSSERVEELIESKWLFFFLVLLLGIEWFIRKYKGAY